MSINRVTILGRLTANPELRATNTGLSVVAFNVAVDRGSGDKKTTDFVPAKAFGKVADLIAQYLQKGSKVAVEGNLTTRTYEDKNNNKRFVMEVLVEKIEFLSKLEKKEEPKEYVKPSDFEKDPFEEFGNTVELDDDFLD